MNRTGKFNIFNTILLIIVSLLFSTNINAQGNEELAVKLFEDEQYSEALPHFIELNRLYPGEAIFQYYYGVCLIETGRYGGKARTLLLQSTSGNVPDNAYFYIGKNYHALSDFENAEIYYTRFDNYARRRSKRAVNFKDVVKLMEQNINPFEIKSTQLATEETAKNQTDDTATPNDDLSEVKDSVQQNEPLGKAPETTEFQEQIIPEALKEKNINFILSPEIRYMKVNQFKTPKGKETFIKAWNKSLELENAINILNALRKEYREESDNNKQQNIAQQMLELELSSIQIKAESDENYLLARTLEMEFWQDAPANALTTLKRENDSIQSAIHLPSVISASESNTIYEGEDSEETEEIEEDEKYIEDERVQHEEVNEAVQTNNIIYKVQVGAYSRGLPDYIDRLYAKIAVLRRIDNYTTDKGVVVYTIGELVNFDDAVKLQQQIRQEGIKDAFVVAFNNGKRITLSEAKEITKQ